MPRGDGTGPMGMGPMTGRAAGYCAGYPVPGYMNPIPGRGWGRGFGRGRGFGGGFGWRGWAGVGGFAPPAAPWAYGQPTAQEERTVLETQMQALQAQLDSVKQRLEEVAAEEQKKK